MDNFKKLSDINLKNNLTDQVGLPVARTLANLVPFAGSALSEILTSVIPNQRMDRIADFLMHLQALISEEELEKIKTLPERVEILEEGMIQAGLTPHKERIKRIAKITAIGLTQIEIDRDKTSRILEILKSLSSSNLIVLCYHRLLDEEPYLSDKIKNFSLKNCSIIQNKHDSEELQKSKELQIAFHEQHLISLGLLKQKNYVHESNMKSLKTNYDYIDYPYLDEDTNYTKETLGTIMNIIEDINETEITITPLGIDILHLLDEST